MCHRSPPEPPPHCRAGARVRGRQVRVRRHPGLCGAPHTVREARLRGRGRARQVLRRGCRHHRPQCAGDRPELTLVVLERKCLFPSCETYPIDAGLLDQVGG